MSAPEKDITNTKTADGDSQRQGSVTKGTVYGDNIDDVVLRANGHEAVLRRQFNWLSGLGLGFSITNSWVGYLSCFGQSLIYGGPQVCILGLVVAFIVQSVITLGLSEIASAFPSSGGQYHFCFILAPEKTKRFTGYVVGWMSILAWYIVTCSGISLSAATLAGIISFFNPDFVAQQWQVYLLYVATAVITLVPVFIASKKLAYVVQISLFLSVLGMFITLFTTVGMHKQTQPASFLVEGGLGTSGWSDGVAWVLGITNCMYAFGATDGAIHISEEIEQPGRRVPQVIVMTLVVGVVTCLPLFLALMFFMKDLDAVTSSPLPSMELIYQAVGSKGVTIFLISWLLAIYVLALPSQWVTCGRISWAFARDGGMPLSDYFKKVDRRLEFPVRTTLVAFVFVLLYGLLYLASTTAFNSIITSAVLFLNITYAAPQGILLTQGRDKLPARYFNLGWFGYLCNWFSITWIVVLGVFVCMPPALPVETETMNYISVIVVGLFGIIIAMWFASGRKRFEGPHIDWDAINEANKIDINGQGVGPS